MKRALGQIWLLGLTFLAVGCLQFKEQTMSYRYVKESDELRIFQDYRGIFASDDFQGINEEDAAQLAKDVSDELSENDLADLGFMLSGRKVFFFSSWPFVFDRERLESPDKDEPEELAALSKLLLKNISVRDATFYLNDEGEFSGIQSVTVKKFSEVVAAVNRSARAFLSEGEDDGDASSEADRKLVEKARQAGDWKLLEFEGNVLSARWPMSEASYEEQYGEKSDAIDIEGIREAGIQISWEDDVVTFTLGKKGDEITTISMETSDQEYKPNALEAARAKYSIKPELDAEAAAKAFLLGEKSGE